MKLFQVFSAAIAVVFFATSASVAQTYNV